MIGKMHVEKVFYTEEKRKEILKLAGDAVKTIKAPTESQVWNIYDLLAIQINELQKLNNNLESIYKIIQ